MSFQSREAAPFIGRRNVSNRKINWSFGCTQRLFFYVKYDLVKSKFSEIRYMNNYIMFIIDKSMVRLK